MTPEEILTIAEEFFSNKDACLSVREGVVSYYEYFGIVEEPQDVAWDAHCDNQSALNEIGLQIQDLWSDNDTVGGIIVEKIVPPSEVPVLSQESSDRIDFLYQKYKGLTEQDIRKLLGEYND